jgi:hypothetical protein
MGIMPIGGPVAWEAVAKRGLSRKQEQQLATRWDNEGLQVPTGSNCNLSRFATEGRGRGMPGEAAGSLPGTQRPLSPPPTRHPRPAPMLAAQEQQH